MNIALAPLEKAAEELEDEEDEEDHSIFLPFPLTIKEIKPLPYKGTDPEWIEFVKFSKSQELNRSVRRGFRQFHLKSKYADDLAQQMT